MVDYVSVLVVVLVTLAIIAAPVAYLVQVNRLLAGTPEEVAKLSPTRWTRELLCDTYDELEEKPITVDTYADRLPPKQQRRYVVTGGSGLVGGTIVLQLLARGQPPETIRIIDFQKPHREDMLAGAVSEVDFARADISSAAATDAAFAKPWPSAVAHLPLTVFHTAAVIVPSERSKHVYGLCESVNVHGTQHVLDAARRAGADIFVSTSSGSIAIRPVKFWMAPWKMFSSWPRNFWQVLDEADFFKPLRPHEEFFGNYAASKAAAERIVCGANSPTLRTGCIRPANGVYGHPTDNPVGGPLSQDSFPAWTNHFIQCYAHAANVAIAHLHFEAVLTSPESASSPQAGRPYTVTDPNPPITCGDLYYLLELLVVTPCRQLQLQPMPVLLMAYFIEWYSLIPFRWPLLSRTLLKNILPPVTGDARHLKPPLFSITTHLFATNEVVSRPVKSGGLGYEGVVTTLEGMTQEIVDWNHEHSDSSATRKAYQTSVSLADDIEQLGLATAMEGT